MNAQTKTSQKQWYNHQSLRRQTALQGDAFECTLGPSVDTEARRGENIFSHPEDKMSSTPEIISED